MKKIFVFCCFIASIYKAHAQFSTGGNESKCSIDSFKTNKLNISTGIGINSISDSVLMPCGYGYNTYYTSPNNNKDTLWTLSRLSSKYNPRVKGSAGFAYTGPYVSVGGNPFILCAKGNPLDGHYDAFLSGIGCLSPSSSTGMSSNWISVYADAGGQSSGIENDINDGYAYERCFYICNNDTLTFNMNLMADDIIDSVQVDKVNIYTTPSPSSSANYICSKVVSVNKTLVLTAGRHTIRVWTRDNAGGHLALNVYGHIQSSGTKKNIIRSKFDSRCNFNPASIMSYTKVETLSLIANPVTNDLQLSLSAYQMGGDLAVSDMTGKILININSLKNTTIPLDNIASGMYLVSYRLNGIYMRAKMIKN